ncbi:hypothetical protein C8R47DRAFT_1216189 [Mycena vitilis]|nr:hypothetical protein C8R47DRAFT_1216189 [Mycena vitilis]
MFQRRQAATPTLLSLYLQDYLARTARIAIRSAASAHEVSPTLRLRPPALLDSTRIRATVLNRARAPFSRSAHEKSLDPYYRLSPPLVATLSWPATSISLLHAVVSRVLGAAAWNSSDLDCERNRAHRIEDRAPGIAQTARPVRARRSLPMSSFAHSPLIAARWHHATSSSPLRHRYHAAAGTRRAALGVGVGSSLWRAYRPTVRFSTTDGRAFSLLPPPDGRARAHSRARKLRTRLPRRPKPSQGLGLEASLLLPARVCLCLLFPNVRMEKTSLGRGIDVGDGVFGAWGLRNATPPQRLGSPCPDAFGYVRGAAPSLRAFHRYARRKLCLNDLWAHVAFAMHISTSLSGGGRRALSFPPTYACACSARCGAGRCTVDARRGRDLYSKLASSRSEVAVALEYPRTHHRSPLPSLVPRFVFCVWSSNPSALVDAQGRGALPIRWAAPTPSFARRARRRLSTQRGPRRTSTSTSIRIHPLRTPFRVIVLASSSRHLTRYLCFLAPSARAHRRRKCGIRNRIRDANANAQDTRRRGGISAARRSPGWRRDSYSGA